MTTKDTPYEMPNVGCLLGTAYNIEEMRLRAMLQKERLGISPAEYLILRILFSHKEIQQCEISRILGKDKATVSRTIQSLTKKGLVISDQLSYRCCMISLSEKGRSLEPKIIEIAASRNARLSERISKQEQEFLRNILKKIID